MRFVPLTMAGRRGRGPFDSLLLTDGKQRQKETEAFSPSVPILGLPWELFHASGPEGGHHPTV